MTRTAAARLFILFVVLLSAVPALAQNTTYRISWAQNPEPDIAKYIIYRSLDPNSGFVAIDSVDAPTLEYADTGLAEGTRYYYRITAKNTAGLESAYSNPVSGMTIPEDASPAVNALCDITSFDKVGDSSYNVNWSTQNPTTGFVQYGVNEFDSMSDVDNTIRTSHVSPLTGLLMPGRYLTRAVSYDNSNNMTISMVDTLTDSSEDPVAPTAPLLSIFPIPFLPGMGDLTMTNLPEGGSVAIYSADGLEVWTADVGTETTMTWDGKNAQGSPVMSGVYYVVTKDSESKVVNKRPIMIVN
jgi:hypothetical protein